LETSYASYVYKKFLIQINLSKRDDKGSSRICFADTHTHTHTQFCYDL